MREEIWGKPRQVQCLCRVQVRYRARRLGLLHPTLGCQPWRTVGVHRVCIGAASMVVRGQNRLATIVEYHQQPANEYSGRNASPAGRCWHQSIPFVLQGDCAGYSSQSWSSPAASCPSSGFVDESPNAWTHGSNTPPSPPERCTAQLRRSMRTPH